VHHSNRHVALA